MSKLFNTVFWVLILLGVCFGLLKIILGSLNSSEEVKATSGALDVKVVYTPAEAGDDRVFGYRVPYHIVWRAGAGDATEIHFSKTAYVEGKRIKAGNYSLWILPELEHWTLIFNSETGQYGTRYDASKDVYKVRVPVRKWEERVDPMKISIDTGLVLNIVWENTGVAVAIRDSDK